MTSRGKRLTLGFAVGALVVVVVGAILAPELLAAPRKGGNTGDFAISARLDYRNDSYRFQATGAIADSGLARGKYRGLELIGAQGTIDISFEDDTTFTIAGGTGAYENLAGTGAYTKQVKWEKSGDPWPSPYYVVWRVDYHLTGTTL